MFKFLELMVVILIIKISLIKCQTFTVNDYSVCGKRLNEGKRSLKIVNGNQAILGDWPWQV